MKRLNFVAAAILSTFLVLACDVSQVEEEFQGDIQSLDALALEGSADYKAKNYRNGKLPINRALNVVVLKASFSTNSLGAVEDPQCNAPRVLETQEGEGYAKDIGGFTILFTFCIDATDVVEDGELTGNDALPYYKGLGTFTFENGDKLFGKASGAVIPSDKPGYDFEFTDPFVFTEGTGRFEGAQGGGITNSFVVFGGQTDHEFSAVLVLPKHRGYDRDDDE